MLQHIPLNHGIPCTGQIDSVAGIRGRALVHVIILNPDIAVRFPVTVLIIRRSSCTVPVGPSRIVSSLVARSVPLLYCNSAERIVNELAVLNDNITELGRLVPGRFQTFNQDTACPFRAVASRIIHNSLIL